MRILCEWFTVFVLHIIRFHEIFHIENGARPQLPSSKSREREKNKSKKMRSFALYIYLSISLSIFCCQIRYWLFSFIRFKRNAITMHWCFASLLAILNFFSAIGTSVLVFVCKVLLYVYVCFFFCSFFCTIIANEILFVYSGKLFNFNDSSRLCHTKGNKWILFLIANKIIFT